MLGRLSVPWVIYKRLLRFVWRETKQGSDIGGVEDFVKVRANMKYMKRPMILLVPYPAQGHVTPLLKLASCLVTRGFMPVMITPEYIHRQIAPRMDAKDGILCMSIPDGVDEDVARDFFTIEMTMENTMPVYLERLIRKLDEDGRVVSMVVDLLASWAIKVADQCGVPAAGFWPAMLATYGLISAIPELIRTGLISESGIPDEQRKICSLPCQPDLTTEDLPWLIGTFATTTARFKFWTRTLARSKTLPWILVNSFPEEFSNDKLQNQLIYSPEDSPHILQIGPLNKHAANAMRTPSFWEADFNCLDWLEQQKPCTVVYISFGSWVSPIGEGKVTDLALALEASGRPFIWVLGPKWREGLPVGYMERVSKQGKVVSWAPQMELLQHEAVGCYLTHCGWNSTLEAIQSQKRLLCYPVAGDQFVNCAYIVKVWQIGVRIHGFGQRDLEEGMRKVMEDSEMSKRLSKLNERIMGEEASLRVVANITTFTDNLKKHVVH